MQIEYRKAAIKTLKRMTPKDSRRVRDAVRAYAATDEGDVKRLQGSQNEYRLRVGGWRVLFEREGDRLIVVFTVGPRGDVYK